MGDWGIALEVEDDILISWDRTVCEGAPEARPRVCLMPYHLIEK
jgi:hypothetical protein